MVNLIDIEDKKEKEKNIWNNSDFYKLPKLQSNNIGKIGELFLNNIGNILNIESSIDGIKTKKIGGGLGDGKIKNKTGTRKSAKNNFDKIQ